VTGYRKRPPSSHAPMDPMRRAHIYQAANGVLPAGALVILADDTPVRLTGPQRRRWLHRARRAQ
jgi:hypothetical protein